MTTMTCEGRSNATRRGGYRGAMRRRCGRWSTMLPMPTSETTVPLPHTGRQRRLLVAGVGVAAAAAGAGLALWRHQPDSNADASSLWTLTFDTPAGQQLAMTALRGKPLLVNFWATWCPP